MAHSVNSITVTDGRVHGLQYDGSLPVESGRQSAVFACTANVSPPAGGVITGYNWFFANVDQHINSSSASLKAIGVGKREVRCVYYYFMPPFFNYYSSVTTTVAAIGGPLNLGVVRGSSGNAPYHDNNTVGNPVYLQYFYPANHTLVQYEQAEQTGKVSAGAQPTGVTVTYHLPGFLVTSDAYTNIPPSQLVNVRPDNANTGAVTATFTMNDGDLSGTANDDTSSTPGVSYQFHSHYPGSMFLVQDADYGSNPKPVYTPDGGDVPPADLYGCWGGYYYLYGLKDSEGVRMPGVWVQESFGPGVIPGLNMNNPNLYWESIWDYPFGQQVAFDSTPTTGAAYFNAEDRISCEWPYAGYPWFGQLWDFYHYYHGATRNTDGSGILVGTYTITMHPGGPSNIPHADVHQSEAP